MKNFKKVLSKTVASVYTAQPSRQSTPYTRMPAHWHTWMRPQGAQPLTYGFAIRKPLRKVYQKTLGKFYQTRGMLRIPQHCASRSFGFQTTGMLRIPEHHVNRGIGLRGHTLPRRDSGRHKGA